MSVTLNRAKNKMDNSTINNNQKAINYLTKKFNSWRLQRDAANQGYDVMFAKAVNTTTWAEWDEIVPAHYDSSTYTAWHDQDGFEFMKPRLIQKMVQHQKEMESILQGNMASILSKIEQLKKNETISQI
jgi:hypothetical protein